MVVTHGSSKPQTKTRRSRVSAPRYSLRRKKKFDFAVYDKKLARVAKKTKAAAQSKRPPTNSTAKNNDNNTTKIGDLHGNSTTNGSNKGNQPKHATRTTLEGIGKVSRHKKTKTTSKSSVQLETPATKSVVTTIDDTNNDNNITKIGDLNGYSTTNGSNKRKQPKHTTRIALEGIGKVSCRKKTKMTSKGSVQSETPATKSVVTTIGDNTSKTGDLNEKCSNGNNEKRPVRNATRIALKGIGKVARYEHDVEPNEFGSDDNDRDPTFIIRDPSINSTTTGELSDKKSSVGSRFIDEDDIPSLPSLPKDFFKTPSSEESDDDVHSTSTCPLTILHRSLKEENVKNKNIDSVLMNNINVVEDQHPCIKRTDGSVQELYEFFGIPPSISSNIPSLNERMNSTNIYENKQRWSGMKSISSRCIYQILNSIFPGPCKSQLYKSIGKKLIKNDNVKDLNIMKFQSNIDTMLDNMFTMMIKAKKGSLEKRIIRSLLTKSLKPSEIKRYCCKHEIGSSFISGDMRKQSNMVYDSLMCGEKISVNP